MERYLVIGEAMLIKMLDEASRWPEKSRLPSSERKHDKLRKERRSIINDIYIDYTHNIEKVIA